MKKLLSIISAGLLCFSCFLFPAMTVPAASITYQAEVYATDGEGLSFKAAPDVNSTRYNLLADGTRLMIDQISDGWGHTYYNGRSGWVYLQYTRVREHVTSRYPESGFMNLTYYMVHDTEGEGLELRTQPTNKCSTFGPMRDGTIVAVQAIQDSWAYTYYNGAFGWAHTDYLTPFNGTVSYRATVYDTDGEGLALKSSPDVNSSRILVIPENAQLAIDRVTSDGWGHTSYNGNAGWVALRYTRIVGDYCSDIPTEGYIDARYYTVYNTDGEGLELRTRPSVESSTYGPISDGISVIVQAINGEWAFFYHNGHYGWANLTYLR